MRGLRPHPFIRSVEVPSALPPSVGLEGSGTKPSAPPSFRLGKPCSNTDQGGGCFASWERCRSVVHRASVLSAELETIDPVGRLERHGPVPGNSHQSVPGNSHQNQLFEELSRLCGTARSEFRGTHSRSVRCVGYTFYWSDRPHGHLQEVIVTFVDNR